MQLACTNVSKITRKTGHIDLPYSIYNLFVVSCIITISNKIIITLKYLKKPYVLIRYMASYETLCTKLESALRAFRI